MQKGKPNKLLAPIIIAGITVGFLISAYKFIFHDSTPKKSHVASQPKTLQPTDAEQLLLDAQRLQPDSQQPS